MDKRTLLAATAAILLSPAYASARTWTSSDGKHRFEGDLKSCDAGAGIVTVVLANGQEIRFTLDKLSVEDRDFLTKGRRPAPRVATCPPPSQGRACSRS